MVSTFPQIIKPTIHSNYFIEWEAIGQNNYAFIAYTDLLLLNLLTLDEESYLGDSSCLKMHTNYLVKSSDDTACKRYNFCY